MRGNAFPEPPPATGVDPLDGIVPAGAPVVLYVGRIAAEKGVEHLLEAARRLPEAHVVLAGPDDRHGTMDAVRAALADPATHGRVHVLPPTAGPPYDLYRRADVFVLASGGRELRARRRRGGSGRDAGDRLRPDGGRVGVRGRARRSSSRTTRTRPWPRSSGSSATPALRAALAEGALRAAARTTWDDVAAQQVAIYREAIGASEIAR